MGREYFPGILHGADYNYEQWLDQPDVLEKDFVYMKQAKCNVMAIGIFSWVKLEPEEGRFEFGWLDGLMDRLAANGISAILATPSGARPAWLSRKYPEVCRVGGDGNREHHGNRHNHCRTSPVYRDKCIIINTKLAERYRDHPALLLWHVSNEYNSGDCFCDLCLDAFRKWLKKRYGDLDTLNRAWWTTFWGHSYSAWEQIVPFDKSIHGLMLDWQCFVSDQTIDFFLAESAPLRTLTPDIPLTTNFMTPNPWLDYWSFAGHVDIVSWDNYPRWHVHPREWMEGVRASFFHDFFRSLKQQSFMMMESSPGVTNWQGTSIPKKGDMHLLASLQAVAHGSDTVQYFQWRQGRGGEEKFHSAVIGHAGHTDTKVFRDVAAVGGALEKLSVIKGSNTKAEVAILYDFQNEWALDNAQLPGSMHKNYMERCIAHYRAFWTMGIPVDLFDCSVRELGRYKLVIAPMAYMLRGNIAQTLKDYVAAGGT
ncbi:MAG: beta-galactosidase, partial [Spirochaetales bacterium]|nr:beta-galactosidase [Spirochaetales bacterium]